ncbi:MAG: two-component system response regulator CreB [Verrucomicrobia bacterium]|nr:two-component system response regulator CreB [Verrucomicrobiota bacterium]
MDERPPILIVEDEPAIADTLLYALKTEGFAPEWCATGRAGLAALTAKSFALVVLDVGLPDGSGFDLCKQIRATSAVPVIFLTARNTELDRVLGLELGGDDYLAKPFSPRELTARVKAVLRRADRTAAASARGPAVCHPLDDKPPGRGAALVVDDERCAIRYRGTVLQLTRYEFRLLKALAANPGRVFSRDQLMQTAWEDPGASLDRTVDAHIKTLRAKLRTIAPDGDPIQTHRGLGYSLRAAQ